MYVLYKVFFFLVRFNFFFSFFFFFFSLSVFFSGFFCGENFIKKLTSGVLVLFNAINSPVYFLIVSPFCAPVFSPSFSSMRSHLDTEIKWE